MDIPVPGSSWFGTFGLMIRMEILRTTRRVTRATTTSCVGPKTEFWRPRARRADWDRIPLLSRHDYLERTECRLGMVPA